MAICNVVGYNRNELHRVPVLYKLGEMFRRKAVSGRRSVTSSEFQPNRTGKVMKTLAILLVCLVSLTLQQDIYLEIPLTSPENDFPYVDNNRPSTRQVRKVLDLNYFQQVLIIRLIQGIEHRCR